MKKILYFSLVLFSFSACKQQDKQATQIATEMYKKLQTQLIEAKEGDVIEIPAGSFEFDKSLSLDKVANVTIRGAGIDKTVLSFKSQMAGAEGIRAVADNITIENMTIQDTKGDGIKLQHCKGITLRNLKITWSGGADEKNGGYGLYPVESENILIEKCEVAYASDAGIYVGQSQNVVVKDCYAHENVAGIEIENCIRADVFHNRAEKNTGGILVFNLPDLKLKNGHTCRVFENQILDNNHDNFAPAGNMVAITPPGAGIILLAAQNTEVFKNTIKGHKTLGITVASFHVTQRPMKDTAYNPFSFDIAIHDNTLERKSALPDLSTDFGKMVNLVFKGSPQDILYDGILDDKRKAANAKNPMNLCVKNNTATEGLRFANVDAAHNFKNVVTDPNQYDCESKALEAVKF